MPALRNTLIAVSAMTGMFFCAATARSAGPVPLVDSQLDKITAGGAAGVASASGLAAGLYAIGNTSTLVIVSSEPSNSNSDAAWSGQGAFSSGVVALQASNVTSAGTTSSSVNTDAVASGNFVYKLTLNKTVQGNGASVQLGFTYVNAGLIPGLF